MQDARTVRYASKGEKSRPPREAQALAASGGARSMDRKEHSERPRQATVAGYLNTLFFALLAFGEDEAGNLFVADYGTGTVYRVTAE